MKIRNRVSLIVGLTALITTAAVTTAVVFRAGDLLETDARQSISLLTERFAMRVKLKVDMSVEKSLGLGRLVSGAHLLPPAAREGFLGAALSAAVDSDTALNGAWYVGLPGSGQAAALSLSYSRGSDGTGGGRGEKGLDDPAVKAVLESGLVQISDPETRRNSEGGTGIVLGIAAPVMLNRAIVGVVGIDLSMNEIASMVNAARSWKGSYGFLIANDESIVVHPKSSLIGKNIFEVGGYGEAQAAAVKKSRAARGTANLVKPNLENGRPDFQSYFSFPFASTDAVWTFGVSVPEAEIRAGALSFATTTIGIAAIVILGGLAAAWIQGQRLAKPLVALRDEARRMAEERDLSFALKAGRGDEIAESIAALTGLFAEIGEFVAETSRSAEGLRLSGEELAAAMEETSVTTEQIAEAAGRVRALAENQGASTQEVSASSLQIARRAEELSAIAERQAASAEKSGGALESLIEGARLVGEGFAELRAEFGALVQNAAAGSSKLDAAALANEEVARRSEDLVLANRALANVAAKTNILAMNAAIEAAHAGDYGRGFAVVAQEIRSLAETAAVQSHEIERTLKEIRAGIHGANDSSLEAREAFGSITGRIERADHIQGRIGAAVERQATAFRSAEEAVAVAAHTSRDVADAAAEMRQSGQENAKEMENLVRGGAELLESIDSIESGARAIASGAEESANETVLNKERLEALSERAASFKTGLG